MRAAADERYPGKGDDAVRERQAVKVLTGWKPGMDNELGREAMRALFDLEVAKGVDTAYELSNSGHNPGKLTSVFTASLKTLNEVRAKLNPGLAPLTPEAFKANSVVLFTASGRSGEPQGLSL